MTLHQKINKLLVVPALLSCLIFTTKTAAQANELPRGYSQTCTNIEYDDDTGELFVRCRTIDGDNENSSINLNKYIANYDGKLAWSGGGNYIDSVGRCNIINVSNSSWVQPTYLKCQQVRSKNGEEYNRVIVLDEHIENVDGQLEYYN